MAEVDKGAHSTILRNSGVKHFLVRVDNGGLLHEGKIVEKHSCQGEHAAYDTIERMTKRHQPKGPVTMKIISETAVWTLYKQKD